MPRSMVKDGVWLLVGAVLSFSYAPHLWWPVMFVVLIAAMRTGATTSTEFARRGFFLGVGCFTPMLYWAWLAAGPGYPFLVLYTALWWAGLFFLMHEFALRPARLTSPFAAAAIWTVGEFIRGHYPYGGFTWGDPGYALIGLAPARHLASWGGIHAVTFLLVGSAVAMAQLLDPWKRPPARRLMSTAWRMPLVWCLSIWVASGVVSADGTTPVGSLTVGLVQGNDFNRDLSGAEQSRLLPQRHLELAADFTRLDDLDLIIFPESSFGGRDPRDDAALTPQVADLARNLDAYVLTNSTLSADADAPRYNTNILFDPQGRPAGVYTKQHLVPFGEYIPFRSILEKVVPQVSQVPVDFRPGAGSDIFDIGPTPIGNLICFESAFGRDARDRARQGAQVLVVSTNNRSFGNTSNAAQHVAMSRMRAAETGRAVVHSAISGISAVIDPAGLVTQQTPLLQAATLKTTVPARAGETPYVRFGPWMVVLSGVIIGAHIWLDKVRPRVSASAGERP